MIFFGIGKLIITFSILCCMFSHMYHILVVGCLLQGNHADSYYNLCRHFGEVTFQQCYRHCLFYILSLFLSVICWYPKCCYIWDAWHLVLISNAFMWLTFSSRIFSDPAFVNISTCSALAINWSLIYVR